MAAATAVLTAVAAGVWGGAVLNEVASKGGGNLPDGSQACPNPEKPDKPEDWIELANTGAAAADVSGWKLCDDKGCEDEDAYTFPEGSSIPAGGHLVLCKNEDEPGVGFAFGIGKTDTVTLLDAAGAQADTSGQLEMGESTGTWARVPDMTGAFAVSETPTPGAANAGAAAQGAACGFLEPQPDDSLKCGDGTVCEVSGQVGWDCCVDHGGRAKCPAIQPLMCAVPNCVSGTDYCCGKDESLCEGDAMCLGRYTCQSHGGVRQCVPAECGFLEPQRDDSLKCGDGTVCEVSGQVGWDCCVEHGGRAKCPAVQPLMCAEPNCVSSTDYCCGKDESLCEGDAMCLGRYTCQSHGGVRQCVPDTESPTQATGAPTAATGSPSAATSAPVVTDIDVLADNTTSAAPSPARAWPRAAAACATAALLCAAA